MRSRPVVGLSSDLKLIGPHNYHCVGDKYVRAVTEAAQATAVLLPALDDDANLQALLPFLDGIVLTGSQANVHPRHYGGGEPYEGSPLDPARDAANLRLIPQALDMGLPLFGVCRGFQEMNVALGGTLHQKVHEQPGFHDHREDESGDLDAQYGPAHPVYLAEGGLLAGLADGREQRVNSLHGQGIDRLAAGVSIEASAADGLVEGFSVPGTGSFALAVQWHPEWKPLSNAFYAATWRAFGEACRRRAAQRR